MKKIVLYLLCVFILFSCSKRDPILPGIRHDIFDSNDVNITNQNIEQLSGNVKKISGDEECDYIQDVSNIIWQGKRKIFEGFSGGDFVKSNQSPICVGKYIYTGFSTGEVVKINATNKKIIWITDVFKENNLTGGASVVDIVAHVGVDKDFVYAGGLGDAFCKLNANNGNKIWCIGISVPVDFILIDDFAFVVGSDNNLYAINANSGTVYWKTGIKKQVKPEFNGNVIKVGNQKVDYKDGSLIKK